MFCKLSAMAAGFTLLALFSGCSQQQATPSSSGPQVASANTGDKCVVDVKRVCQELKDRPVIDPLTGQTQDRTEREQNSRRTDSRFTSLQIPGGAMLQVQCEINTMHNSVVYAYLMPSPPLTATDVAYLQNIGYCAH